MAFDTGPISTENQFPCQTLVARLVQCGTIMLVYKLVARHWCVGPVVCVAAPAAVPCSPCSVSGVKAGEGPQHSQGEGRHSPTDSQGLFEGSKCGGVAWAWHADALAKRLWIEPCAFGVGGWWAMSVPCSVILWAPLLCVNNGIIGDARTVHTPSARRALF